MAPTLKRKWYLTEIGKVCSISEMRKICKYTPRLSNGNKCPEQLEGLDNERAPSNILAEVHHKVVSQLQSDLEPTTEINLVEALLQSCQSVICGANNSLHHYTTSATHQELETLMSAPNALLTRFVSKPEDPKFHNFSPKLAANKDKYVTSDAGSLSASLQGLDQERMEDNHDRHSTEFHGSRPVTSAYHDVNTSQQRKRGKRRRLISLYCRKYPPINRPMYLGRYSWDVQRDGLNPADKIALPFDLQYAALLAAHTLWQRSEWFFAKKYRPELLASTGWTYPEAGDMSDWHNAWWSFLIEEDLFNPIDPKHNLSQKAIWELGKTLRNVVAHTCSLPLRTATKMVEHVSLILESKKDYLRAALVSELHSVLQNLCSQVIRREEIRLREQEDDQEMLGHVTARINTLRSQIPSRGSYRDHALKKIRNLRVERLMLDDRIHATRSRRNTFTEVELAPLRQVLNRLPQMHLPIGC